MFYFGFFTIHWFVSVASCTWCGKLLLKVVARYAYSMLSHRQCKHHQSVYVTHSHIFCLIFRGILKQTGSISIRLLQSTNHGRNGIQTTLITDMTTLIEQKHFIEFVQRQLNCLWNWVTALFILFLSLCSIQIIFFGYRNHLTRFSAKLAPSTWLDSTIDLLSFPAHTHCYHGPVHHL